MNLINSSALIRVKLEAKSDYLLAIATYRKKFIKRFLEFNGVTRSLPTP